VSKITAGNSALVWLRVEFLSLFIGPRLFRLDHRLIRVGLSSRLHVPDHRLGAFADMHMLDAHVLGTPIFQPPVRLDSSISFLGRHPSTKASAAFIAVSDIPLP